MSKYLEYTRYANTGATAGSAPVLGRFVNRDKPMLEALCEEIKLNGGTPMDTETLLYIITGTLDYIREQYALRCVRYRLFGITFEVACYGPFETADAKFDPARNSLEVAVRLGDELKNCLVNETPTLVTEETASTARIYRAMDIASGALGIIIGTRSFRVTGRNIYVSREGESLKLMDGKGRLFDIAYDKIESPQRVEGHLVEMPTESGTCKLILTTYGGDDSEDARLGIYERVVNFVKFVEPPTVGGIRTASTEDGTVKNGEDVIVTGEHLAGATVKIKYKTLSEEERQTYECPSVIAEDGKVTIPYESWRLVPDDLEGGTTIEFIVETAGGSASRGGIAVDFTPPAPTLTHARSPGCDDMTIDMHEDVILNGTNLKGFERLVAHQEEYSGDIELPTSGVSVNEDGTELAMPGSVWDAITEKVDPSVMPTRPVTFEVITPGGSASISPTVS